MKRWLFFAVSIAMMFAAVSVSAQAIDDDWRVFIRVGHLTNDGSMANSAVSTFVGTSPNAVDGYNGVNEDQVRTPFFYDGYCEIDCVDLAEEAGTERINGDLRAPLSLGKTKIWNLRGYINYQSSGTFDLVAWMYNTCAIDSNTIKVMLYESAVTSVNYMLYTPLVTFDQGTTGTQILPNYTDTFSYTGGYKEFTIVAKAVPEPGSAIALLTGICGILCFKRGHRRS